MSINLGISHF